jgi:hypothetical protein
MHHHFALSLLSNFFAQSSFLSENSKADEEKLGNHFALSKLILVIPLQEKVSSCILIFLCGGP